MALKSHWIGNSKLPRFRKLNADLEVDVAIVGGGITGITAAHLLKKAGRSVALVERDRCAQADTGHTTAHLTYVTDTRLTDLVKAFGKDHAQAGWDAGRAAMAQIRSLVEEQHLDCDYRSVPGYLHAAWKKPAKDEAQLLQKEATLAAELGFDATYTDSVPFANRPGIRFANQAKFHPLRYLAGLLPGIAGEGSHVFENTEIDEFQPDPLAIMANGHKIRCEYVILATHVPLTGTTGLASAALFQTKLASYSSYAVGAKVPRGSMPEAIFSDTSDPYYYLRLDKRARFDYAIFGGEDHKTGQEADAEACLQRLEEMLGSILPKAKVDARWTGQVVETHDGLPYIGETADRQFAATGFAGNGMTFGTLAAMMATDAALGKKNPWRDLFDVNRKNLAGVWDYIKENSDYPYYYLKDKMAGAEGTAVADLPRNEGKILKLDGQRVAAFRNAHGKVITLSPVCTHMGCNVHWNKADSTWDCPCHGSRFQATGEVLAGPAETPLEPLAASVPTK
jgi:glycine/D-amino acid oxidase-like deaminating enzyme/nitrite reductase/ring-hydroxylating ferredoxin subunit